MALSAANVKIAHLGTNPQTLPQKGSTTIYQGGIVMCDSSGYARPGATATGMIGVGVALDNGGLPSWTNSGSDGASDVNYEDGVFGPFANSGSSIAVGDEGKDCYILDDATVHRNDGTGTRSPAGRIHSVTSEGVYVYFSAAWARQIAEAQIVSTGQAYTQTYSTANRTVANPTASAIGATLTDSTGGSGTHDDTLAAITAPTTLLVGTLGGAADTTLESVGATNGGDVSGAIMNNFQDLFTQINLATAAITVIKQNQSDVAQKVIELVTAVNALITDDLDNRQTIGALIDDLQTADIVD